MGGRPENGRCVVRVLSSGFVAGAEAPAPQRLAGETACPTKLISGHRSIISIVYYNVVHEDGSVQLAGLGGRQIGLGSRGQARKDLFGETARQNGTRLAQGARIRTPR